MSLTFERAQGKARVKTAGRNKGNKNGQKTKGNWQERNSQNETREETGEVGLEGYA